MKTKTIYLVTGDDANEPVCAFESEKDVIEFCRKHNSLGWSPVQFHFSDDNDNLITELDKRINECRHYLMGVLPENLTVEDALEALGFQRNGLLS